MKTDIPYSKRDPEIQVLQLALRLVGLDVSYEAASLIKVTIDKLDELGGDFSLKDASKIQLNEEEKFEKLFQELSKPQQNA